MSGGQEISRRRFLQVGGAAAGGLVLGFHLPGGARFEAAAAETGTAQVNAWLRIAPDNRVTILVSGAEMGQGVYTAMPMLIAEELGVDWSQVRAETAPADVVYYNRYFESQATGGSTSIRQGFDHLREAGAAAREMLRQAAAARWGVSVETCSADGGRIRHRKTRRALTYGELASDAAKLEPPENIALKDPKDWSILGKPIPRLDTPAKTTGRAVFGTDVQRPGMLVGSVHACPTFGGKLVSVDEKPALSVPGVKRVIPTESAVIVVADGYWNAKKGLEALEPVWEHGPNASLSSAGIRKQMRAALDGERGVARSEGDCDAAFGSAVKTHEASFEAPYLAHATMEPMNATVHVRDDGADIWVPTQAQTRTQTEIAEEFGFELEQVRVHTTFLGGGFGRRSEYDFVRYAAIASKAVGAPVKVLWSREEDMRHDYYRPASMVRFSAALDESGAWSAFRAHVVAPSIEMRFGRGLTEGVDRFAVEGIDETLYQIPNQQIEYGFIDAGVPVGFWRAVGHSQNAFFMEAFIDEVAHAAGTDPLEFRLRLLRESPRQAAVVSRVAEMSGWGEPLPKGRFRGLAAHHSHGSHTAQVAEISIESDRIRVHRVHCAFDCGVVVNPDTVEAQLESGIIYGLTAALHGEITLEGGRVQQGNFPDYPMVTLATAPAIDVHVMKSSDAPGGVGEPSTPPIAPAVANAVFAATGVRIRKLPIRI